MATSTVRRVGEQTELEKVNILVTGEEPEQQIEDEQWEFIRDEVEKMKEARELAQKEQQRLKEEQEKVKEQRAKLEAEEQRLQEQQEKTQDSILRAKRGLEELQSKITSVNKIAQQEREGQLDGSIELVDSSNKRIEDILKTKDEVLGLTLHPSSESLCEFGSEERDLGQYWYYAVKAEQIKKNVTKAFHEKDDYYRDLKLYDSFYAEYTRHIEKLHQQLKAINEILSK